MSDTSKRRFRFENVASKRTQKVIDYLESLSKCSNKVNYEYSEVDIRKMFKAIKDSVSECESSFEKQLNKSNKKKFKF
jgi:uncharacterized protein with HEPN domain